ncbi:RNA polymerase sigma factor sigC isoform X1 [Iris pallida]|uniref:RNA polymerase sigma factor sigC isoform X1 n=1 Tax=Iris pallida TaxID=29817 RepID=A0AAX6G3X0_IRIPA|nr:RNA polymerase sigma factor sigC isoform X1 [Iris pallida]
MGIGSMVPWRRWVVFPIQSSSIPKQRHSSPSPSCMGGRVASSEPGRSNQNLVLEGGEIFFRDSFKFSTSSPGAVQSIEKTSADNSSVKINGEMFSNGSHVLSGPVNIIDDASIYVFSLKSSNHLQFSLLMENLGDIEDILTRKDVARLEREILSHIGSLGALELFHACLSRTLMAPSAANPLSLLTRHFSKFPINSPEVQKKDTVIFRTGKKEERKLRRTRASLKRNHIVEESKVSTSRSSGGHKVSSKSNSRSLIARSESEMSKAVKEVTDLERTRSRLEGEIGQLISYARWAEAAGIDQKILQQRLQFGWFCRDKLIRSTHSLVVYFARNYKGMGIAFDDLLQAGKMGVLKGAERFDSTKGYQFSTYVRYWIRKAMLTLVAKHSKGIHIPVTVDKFVKRVQKARKTFYIGEGRYPEDDEMAELTGLPLAKVRLAKHCSRVGGSLDQEMAAGHRTKFMEIILDTSVEAPEEIITRHHMREDVMEVLEGLHPRERQVLALRYGLEDGRCKSLGEIGRLCHVTKEWIRKIEKQALAKIRRDDIQRELKCYLHS